MSDVLDIATFDIFDFNGSRDKPDDINVRMPGKTAEEQELLDLQLEALRRQAAPPTEQELALQSRATDYYNQMVADETLSDEESAEFDKEYELQVGAMEEQYGTEMEHMGGSRMAELAARGVMDTTTGRDIVARDQQRYSGVLAENIAEMGTAKELAKSDMGAAKREMSQQGYNLTAGILQSRDADMLRNANMLQDYYSGNRQLTAANSLQNALRGQAWDQWAYNSKMGGLSKVAGIGIGMMQSGARGG